MISDSATLLLFAIKTASKLGEQSRLAYVDATRRREMTLPLPHFFAGTTAADAAQFFQTPALGAPFLSGADPDSRPGDSRRLTDLLREFDAAVFPEGDPRISELVAFHVKYRNVLNARENPGAAGQLSAQEILALLSVQQWRKGTDPTPTTLQRVGGTLIEIGIEYAITTPGLFERNSRSGKLALGFLTALDEVNFSEAEISELPARLFVAALETAGEHPELLTSDQKAQELLRVTTKGLTKDVVDRLRVIDNNAALDPIDKRAARQNVHDWAELLFRGTLATGGRLVLSDPVKYLSATGPGNSALITAVGTGVLDFTLADGKNFGALLSRPGLETILSATLQSVAEHPEILGKSNNRAVSALLSGLATDLANTKGGVLRPDLLPDIARLTLQRTGQNLLLYWPNLTNRPGYNALAAAATLTLQILSTPPAAGQQWRTAFRTADLVALTELVLDELVANPGWVIDRAGKLSPELSAVLATVQGALRERADPRLSAATGAALLQIAFRAVALRAELATKVGGDVPMVGKIVHIVLAAAFDPTHPPAVTWRMVGADAIAGLLEETFAVMTRHPLHEQALAHLETSLRKELKQLASGLGLDLKRFATLLAAALA